MLTTSAMHALDIATILWKRRRLRARESWSRARLEAHQAKALAELRAFATARSPFYREAHRGLERAPLHELPVVTKKDVTGAFEAMVTDPALRLAALREHLDHSAGELHLGRYHVAATSGSSGVRTIVPTSRDEWTDVIASYARANEWAGLRVVPWRRTRMAVVSSRSPAHQSFQVSRTVESPFVVTERYDAGHALAAILDGLDCFQPEVLVAYASMVRMLAEEQLAGRLHIRPRALNCSSEVLTPEARARAREAWGVGPFEVYAATETGGIAAECDRHRGMHLFEDLVIVEVVDGRHRPVPDGEAGERLLVTVLSSRTLPLIRYELTDCVRLAEHGCDCGRPFRLVAAVEGRTDDILEMPGVGDSPVRVHPVVFEGALDPLHAHGWQVRQTERGLAVQVVAPAVDVEAVRRRVADVVTAAGARPGEIEVAQVAAIPAGASGKRPLVIARR